MAVLKYYDSTSGQWLPAAYGAQGTQGTNGSQGVLGSQGAIGAGTQGTVGTQGTLGSQGALGTQGALGSQGAVGTQGTIGAGTQGTIGSQGVVGSQGAIGSQGALGTQGVLGSQGAIGAGTQGTIGSQGTVGTGTQGTIGSQGTVGTSTQGTVGSQGLVGSQGAIGTQGAIGAGTQGTVGSGTQGTLGTQGALGTQGTLGSGTQGTQGTTGAGGGSGPSGYAAMRGFTSTVTSASTVILTNTSTPYQLFTGTLAQAVSLPAVNTLALGWTFHIDNDSTNTITVSGGAGGSAGTVITIPPLFAARIICISITVDAVASWDAIYSEYHTYTGSGNMVFGTSPTITNLTHATGTTALAPEVFTSGTNLTTAIAGAKEYDGKVFYGTHESTNRGVDLTEQFIALTGNYTTAAGTANVLKQAFNVPANGTLTVAGNTTYFFECLLNVTTLSATSGNFQFGLGGTATYSRVQYIAIANKLAATVQTASSHTVGTVATATVITAANTTTTAYAFVQGIIVVGTGGTIIPSTAASVANAYVMLAGNYFRIRPIGLNTVQSVGTWT
jgi:hypothetical protein